jgi:hypothetical protein
LKIYIQVNWKNLDEMDKFLDACNQPKVNKEDINHLNSPIACNEIETVITVSLQRAQDLMDS